MLTDLLKKIWQLDPDAILYQWNDLKLPAKQDGSSARMDYASILEIWNLLSNCSRKCKAFPWKFAWKRSEQTKENNLESKQLMC